MRAVGLSVHAFIEALLAIAKRRCSGSETLMESFQRLVSGCQAALEDERRRLAASVPRVTPRRRLTPTLTPGRWQAERCASSGALLGDGAAGSERVNTVRRVGSSFTDVNRATPRRQAFVSVSEKNDCPKTEH